MWESISNLSLPMIDLTDDQGVELCKALRHDLVRSVAQTGGHLASNLGAVELTVAIHRAYDTSRDRVVFDVGHQCYIHKILTGRAEQMSTLRQYGGLAGFPKPTESVHDAFIAGHASNSVSVAVGMARARTIRGEDYDVLALIGDGALTGGLAYEGLSDAGGSGERMVVVVNDNGMSIKKNVGGMASLLRRHHLRPTYLGFKRAYRTFTRKLPGGKKLYAGIHKIKKAIKGTLLPCSMFEDMGFTYIGPVDGHNLSELTRLLRYAKQLDGPTLLHVRTIKGKGYPPAEQTPASFHGVNPFRPETGLPLKASGENFSAVFGRTLCRLAEENPNVCAVTAAMESGTGLSGFAELEEMVTCAVNEAVGPVAVRYPRGGENGYHENHSDKPTVILREGTDMTLVTYGTLVGEALRAAEQLEQRGIRCEVVKLGRIFPLDSGPVLDSVKKTHRLTVVEEVASRGSVGRDLATQLAALNVWLERVILLNAGDGLVTHGSVSQLWAMLGIDADHIASAIEEAVL